MPSTYFFMILKLIKKINGNNFLGLLISLCLAIAIGAKLPIYPDEIATRILIERYFFSGHYKVSLTPYCSEGFLILQNGILLISAIFWSLLPKINLDYLYRGFPVFIFLLTIAITFLKQKSIKEIRNPWFLLLGIQGAGIYSFIIIRPEVFIAFFIAIIFCVGLHIIDLKNNLPHRALICFYCVIIFLVYALACFVHPKSLYLILPILVIYYFIFDKIGRANYLNLFISFILILTLFVAYESVALHSLSINSCKFFPEIEKIMKAQGVNALQLFNDPQSFFSGFQNTISFDRLKRSLFQASFKKAYDINFLPPTPRNFFVCVVILVNYATLLFALFFSFYFFAKALICKVFDKRLVLLVSVLLVDICFFIFDTTKNWYNINLEVFIIGLIIFWQTNTTNNFYSKSRNVLFSFVKKLKLLILISILLSIVVNYFYVYKKFDKGFESVGFSADLNLNDFNSFIRANFSYEFENLQLPLIIDDLTYNSFFKHTRIYAVTYTTLFVNNLGVSNYTRSETLSAKFFENATFPIGITRCTYMPANSIPIKKVKYGFNNIEICKWKLNQKEILE